MYKEIPETTFGKTPAAMYLARVLNNYADQGILTMVGKRINATQKQVKELLHSYEVGHLSAKTLANCLRLMRDEISSERTETMDNYKLDIIHDLRKNVQIGVIKAGLRLATVARKAERVMQDPYKRAISVCTANKDQDYFTFYDHQHKVEFVAGTTFFPDEGDEIFVPRKFKLSDLESVSVNAELLHARSEARCKRLKKPHTLCE